MANELQKDEEAYGLLAGPVNELMVQRIFNSFSVALNSKVKRVHLLMQTTGGFVGDGIALYNFMRKLPLEITVYNGGWVQSAGVTVFLGAQKRKASKTASFMIHRSHFSGGIPASSFALQAITDSLAMNDIHNESILRAHLKMPDEKWRVHDNANLHFDASTALEYGLIDEIADFAPPLGGTIFNILNSP